MKKKLLCTGLLFAMIFAFAACGGATPPDGGNNTPPESGEKLYAAHYFTGGDLTNDELHKGTLLTSMEELQAYRETMETVVNKDFTDKLDTYSTQYFEGNVLIAFGRGTSSGQFKYTVKTVEDQDGAITVTIQEYYEGNLPDAVDTVSFLYAFLIEYPKGDYTQLKIEKIQQVEMVSDNDI